VAPKLAEMGQILKLMHTRLSLKYSRRNAATTADANKDDSDFQSADDFRSHPGRGKFYKKVIGLHFA
jgi:hypothetical protein